MDDAPRRRARRRTDRSGPWLRRSAYRLQERIRESGPLCVGVDPSRALLDGVGAPRHRRRTGVLRARGARGGDRSRRRRSSPRSRSSSDSGRPDIACSNDSSSKRTTPTSWSIADAKRGDFALTNEGYAAGVAARDVAAARRRRDRQPLPRGQCPRASLRRGVGDSGEACSCSPPRPTTTAA